MALVLKGGSVFLHIPKTGGNWITKALEESGLVDGRIGHKHADIDKLLSPMIGSMRDILRYYVTRHLGMYPRGKPFMFCFVRNPLTWYESWFKYMSQPGLNWRYWGDEKNLTSWHPNSVLNGLGDSDFNQFVRNVVSKRPGYVTELFGWYTKPQIDFVGKQENLGQDLICVLRTLGLDFDVDLIMSLPEFGVSEEPRENRVGS